jgi:hypothetical protein
VRSLGPGVALLRWQAQVVAYRGAQLASEDDLSITHKLGLFLNNLPSGRQILQALPASPDGSDARFAIGLATEKAAEPRDPAHSFADSRDFVRQAFRFVNAHVERFPFDVGQRRRTRQLGLTAGRLFEGDSLRPDSRT